MSLKDLEKCDNFFWLKISGSKEELKPVIIEDEDILIDGTIVSKPSVRDLRAKWLDSLKSI